MTDSLGQLTDLIARGLNGNQSAEKGFFKGTIEALFGERFHRTHWKSSIARDAYGLARDDEDTRGVPYAGLINPDNPQSGPYGGTSLVWFPGPSGSLIGFGIGTKGIPPDEGIVNRPGHRRRVTGLRK